MSVLLDLLEMPVADDHKNKVDMVIKICPPYANEGLCKKFYCFIRYSILDKTSRS